MGTLEVFFSLLCDKRLSDPKDVRWKEELMAFTLVYFLPPTTPIELKLLVCKLLLSSLYPKVQYLIIGNNEL